MNEQSNDGTVTEADRILAADIFEKMNSEWSCNDIAIQIRVHIAECVRRETEALRAELAEAVRAIDKAFAAAGTIKDWLATPKEDLIANAIHALRTEVERLKADRVSFEKLIEGMNKEYSIIEDQLAAAKAEVERIKDICAENIQISARYCQEAANAQASVQELHQALLRTTGSLGLIVGGADSRAPGHRDNYTYAKDVLAKYADRRAL